MSDEADETRLEIVRMRATPTTVADGESGGSASPTASATGAGQAAATTGAAMRVAPGPGVAAVVGGLPPHFPSCCHLQYSEALCSIDGSSSY